MGVPAAFDLTLTLRLLLATFSQAASLDLWMMIYTGCNSSNSNNRIQVGLIVIVRSLVMSRASTTKQGKSGTGKPFLIHC